MKTKPNQSPPQFRFKPPSLLELASNFAEATAKWAATGFPVSTEAEYQRRQTLCNGCTFWNPAAWNGVGRCMKCGCSGAKRWMATAKCPIGIWEGKSYGNAARQTPFPPPSLPPTPPE